MLVSHALLTLLGLWDPTQGPSSTCMVLLTPLEIQYSVGPLPPLPVDALLTLLMLWHLLQASLLGGAVFHLAMGQNLWRTIFPNPANMDVLSHPRGLWHLHLTPYTVAAFPSLPSPCTCSNTLHIATEIYLHPGLSLMPFFFFFF